MPKGTIQSRLKRTNRWVKRHLLACGLEGKFVDGALAAFFQCMTKALENGEAVEVPGGWVWTYSAPSPQSVNFDSSYLHVKESAGTDEVVDLLEFGFDLSAFVQEKEPGRSQEVHNSQPENPSF